MSEAEKKEEIESQEQQKPAPLFSNLPDKPPEPEKTWKIEIELDRFEYAMITALSIIYDESIEDCLKDTMLDGIETYVEGPWRDEISERQDALRKED